MDVRKKLALVVCTATQKTNYKCEFNCEKKGECAYCLVMAEQMVANGVTVQEWISVKDRLPEVDETVLVIDRVTGEVTTAHLGMFNSFVFRDGRGHGASHWMHLPKPPKEE